MKKTAPLSKTQYGIYVECVQHLGEYCYNITHLYTLDGSLDEEKLKAAIESVVAAHPTLFTRIELNEQGEPVQSIDDSETFSLEVEHITDIEEEKKAMVIPFDIYNDRLFRIHLLKDNMHFYLLVDLHHVIGDGTTLKIILNDMDAAYCGKPLEAEGKTQVDVVREEAEMRQTPAFEEDKQWYAQNFDCSDTFSQLIPDLEGNESEIGAFERKMSVSLETIDAFCKTHGIFKSTFFNGVYSYLLAKYNNEQESLFNTVYSGRTDKQLARTVAMLVKTVPVYARFTDDTTVLDFLKSGEEQMKGCRAHDTYSYVDVADDLKLQVGSYFGWHGTVLENVEINGKPTKAVKLDHTTLEVPLYVNASIVDGRCYLNAEYKTNVYSEQLISQFLESYEAVVEGFLSQEYLRDICIATKSQEELLDSFNNNDKPFDDTQTIVSLFRRQAKATPDKTAVVFKEKQFTYAELDAVSDRIAGYIASKGLGIEDVVAILIPRSEWMAIISLGVLKAGCAYQPLDPTYPKERLNFMMQDANVKLLIADEELYSIVDEYKGEVLFTKDVENLKNSKSVDGPKPESLFTLIYTSGSTGVPKGCQLEHRNMVAFCHMHQHALHVEADSRIGAYASFGFDACLLELWPPLIIGATTYIIPEEIRLDLIALNDYFEKNGITHTFMTTQVARSFVNDISNHSLKAFITGGEKLADVNPPSYLLLNGYGPSESICYVTAFPVTEKMQNIPIGKAVENMHLYIMDAYGHRLPVGAAGELWINGPQVGRGYLNRPEKTAESFIETPWGRCYRSGDIVRYLPDGNIQFVGRRDGQVKIRGFRIELTEVETVIRQYPGIKDVTVQAFDEEGGGKFIAAYVVSDEQVDIEALNNFILDQKPPYMVPAVTMQIDSIPLNQNQKVNKKALPKPEKKAADVESNVPMNVLEKEIHDIIAQIINTEDFGITTILGYVGLTSIMSIKLAIQINKRFGVTLDSKALAKTGSVQSIENEILTALMSGSVAKQETAEVKHADMSNFPLSYAQMGVYVDCMKQPTSTVYNIPAAIRFPKGTDAQLLSKSVETIIQAHPQFHVHFDSQGADIIQMIDANQPVVIAQSKLGEAEIKKYMANFVQPFNLRQGPLYRMEIVTTEESVYLLADVHHLIFDGASLDLFLDQLCDLMNDKKIEPETFTYADFVAAQKAAESSEEYAAARDFFQTRLSKVEGMTEIPPDLSNTLEHGTVETVYCPLDFEAIETFCHQRNISPAHHMLAATFYALSRFTNNDQLCITTISNGRSDLRISNTMGMFVNTLALSAEIGEQSVMEFLNETGKNFDETLRHETYPFARIAADYDLTAEMMFAYQMGVLENHEYKGQTVTVESYESDTPKFPLAFFVVNDPSGKPSICLQYNNGLYSYEAMQNLAQSISNVANAFISHPESPLQSVSLLNDTQIALLDSFNNTDDPYDDTQTIVSLFRRQAKATPDKTAVVFKDKRLTFAELDDISDRIAAFIASKGLGLEDIIAILIPRNEWMAIASLGVIKAGCAFQPLDPSYPQERLNFMMKDTGAKLLIADEELRPIVDEYQGDVVYTKDLIQLPPAGALPEGPKPESLFTLVYTSGSTGVPKGGMSEHRNWVAFCHMHQKIYHITSESRVSSYASFGFDASPMEIYATLTVGAELHIIPEDLRLELIMLNDYFEQNHITHAFMTTQVAYQFATSVENHSLEYLMTGGEKLATITPPKGYVLTNGYGPSETICYVTSYFIKERLKNIPIGNAVANCKLYIVDTKGNRLPVGACGELWIAGPQVARGYLNRPEKTAEVFISNPFVSPTSHPLTSKYARCYRTGDIVRYLPDGNIQFVGRQDGQVKIRGFRIELKEVEAVIREYPGIKNATVQAFDYENGGKFIAAYIVSDEQVDIKDLNAFIGKQKPSYMIPAATMQIDSIPLNQNQKVNKKELPKPVIQATDHEYVEPANDTEKLFCKIFSDVLSIEKVGATDNFFELGGTSLIVTRVIIEADKNGHHIAYGDLFANPTPRQLSNFLSCGVDDEDQETRDYNYGAINTVLEGNTLDAFLSGERQPLGNVLLTGATGFLGIHILRELIDSEVPTITCMVRGKDQEAAEHRLKNMLFYYFEKSYKELFGTRIFVVNGDVTQDFTNITTKIDTVFNCAAVVKHFSKGTDIEDVNVGGAIHCVKFCLLNKARLIHVSTYSTAGMSIDGIPSEDLIYTEKNLYFGQNLGNQYVHSKFISERIVLEAVALHKLNAKVMRVGNLAPRSTDGEFQVNFNTNSSMGRIRVFQMLGCYPYAINDEPLEFSPINEVARAIVLLSGTPQTCCVFHPYNNHFVHFGDVLQELSKVTQGPRQVENDEFMKQLDTAKQDSEKAKRLSSLLAYQDLGHGHKVFVIPSENQYTTQVLYRLGFRWSATSWDYVDRLLTAISGFGFFEDK